jgi:hypothetical protein
VEGSGTVPEMKSKELMPAPLCVITTCCVMAYGPLSATEPEVAEPEKVAVENVPGFALGPLKTPPILDAFTQDLAVRLPPVAIVPPIPLTTEMLPEVGVNPVSVSVMVSVPAALLRFTEFKSRNGAPAWPLELTPVETLMNQTPRLPVQVTAPAAAVESPAPPSVIETKFPAPSFKLRITAALDELASPIAAIAAVNSSFFINPPSSFVVKIWCTPKVPLNGGGLKVPGGGLVPALEGFSPSTDARGERI